MLDRKSPPALLRDFSCILPKPAILHMEGFDIIHHRHEQPITKIEFVFNAGRHHEDKIAVARFTSHLLEKGTASHTAHEIANMTDSMGAFLEISADADTASLILFTLNKFFKRATELCCEIIRDANFPEEELESERQIYLQQLKVNEQKNDFIASRALRKNIYGPNHPYGSCITEADVQKLSCEDLKSHHRKHFAPAVIFVSGPASDKDMSFLQKQARTLPALKEKSSVNFPITPAQKAENILNEKSMQSSIRMGRRAIQSHHPDYPTLSLLNHILGGYFGSRLMTNIREEKGLTYGIYSHLSVFKNDAVLTIGASVNKKDAEEALQEIKKEQKKLREELIGHDELETAKNHCLGALQLQLANPFAVTEKLKWLQQNNLPDDYYTALIAQIKDCTSEQLRTAAQEYLTEDKWTSVVAG